MTVFLCCCCCSRVSGTY